MIGSRPVKKGGFVSIQTRLTALRAEMKRAKLTTYIVPSTDPHQSEYTPAHCQRRQWISGFTGSVGDLVVTQSSAFLWTDSRYYLQAEDQLAGSTIELQRQGQLDVPTLNEWLGANLQKKDTVGIDPRLITLKGLDELRRAVSRSGATVKLVTKNLVDGIWGSERPRSPAGAVCHHAKRFAGTSRADKLAGVRARMKVAEASALVVTRLDCIAWLLNIRGSDVDFTPVVVAYALVTSDKAFLFVDEGKVSAALAKKLSPQVEVRPYEGIIDELKLLGRAKLRVWVDPASTSTWLTRALRGATLVRKPSPIPSVKSRKNATEIKGARAAHVRDGLALVRFFSWLSGALSKERVTEISASEKLEGIRAELEHYVGPSFNTISAYGAHGAIVHYAPSAETDSKLLKKGLYLIDTGGQYRDGTTDVTRTITLGDRPTKELRDQFTRVLKGHIALAMTRFPAGVSGQQLDVLARRSLWGAGLDYGHGTGHGVGSFLSVHESPPGVAPARLLTVPLEEGHILSNEPGYYRTGRYGMRIENLMVVVRDQALSRRSQTYLRFETLTLCPIDRRLIDVKLLTPEERRWLNQYHATVARTLMPELRGKDAKWLQRATKTL